MVDGAVVMNGDGAASRERQFVEATAPAVRPDGVHGHLHGAWRRLTLSIPRGWIEDAVGLMCMAIGSTSPCFSLAVWGTNLVDPRSALVRAVDRYRRAELPRLLKLQPVLDSEMIAHAQSSRRGR